MANSGFRTNPEPPTLVRRLRFGCYAIVAEGLFTAVIGTVVVGLFFYSGAIKYVLGSGRNAFSIASIVMVSFSTLVSMIILHYMDRDNPTSRIFTGEIELLDNKTLKPLSRKRVYNRRFFRWFIFNVSLFVSIYTQSFLLFCIFGSIFLIGYFIVLLPGRRTLFDRITGVILNDFGTVKPQKSVTIVGNFEDDLRELGITDTKAQLVHKESDKKLDEDKKPRTEKDSKPLHPELFQEQFAAGIIPFNTIGSESSPPIIETRTDLLEWRENAQTQIGGTS